MKNCQYIFFLCLFISCTNDLTTFSACDSPKFIDCCDGGEFSVLTFNRSKTTSLNSALRVIQETNPDIVGLQESFGFGLDIATSLGYCYYGYEESSVAFLSKYEMEFINDNYIKIYINDKNIINFFNVHYETSSYQPHQIRDGQLTTVWEIEHEAEETRREDFQKLLTDLQPLIKDEKIIVVGGVNEPSHLDWNIEAANLGLNFGLEVDWPISKNLQLIGLKDVYRNIHPNSIQFPGYTWTTNSSDDEIHDRIDYIYYSGNLQPKSTSLIGPDYLSDIVLDFYDSDHRAILVNFSFQ